VQGSTSSREIQQCIDKCLDCYRVCRQTAMNHCLETGGEHVAPDHFRLMISCADLCGTAAGFMLSSSRLYGQVCAACAETCDACASSCDNLGDMDECVRACRECARSCRALAHAAARPHAAAHA
jgi:hypothetical protein